MSPSFPYHLFTPLQPGIPDSEDAVAYVETPPHPLLQGFVHCYWRLSTKKPLEKAFSYRVVADGCMDIFADLNNPAAQYIMGFSSAYTSFPLDPVFNYLGIRFLPCGFPVLFGIGASHLTNKVEELQQVAPLITGALLPILETTHDTEALKKMLDKYFIGVLGRISTEGDPRFFTALHQILSAGGNISLEKSLGPGVSPRQLRRLFDFYIGGSPKTFSKVVRFQQLLATTPSTQSLKKTNIFSIMAITTRRILSRNSKLCSDLRPPRLCNGILSVFYNVAAFFSPNFVCIKPLQCKEIFFCCCYRQPTYSFNKIHLPKKQP